MSACCSGLLEDFSAPRRSGSTFATECKHPKRAFLRRLFSLLNYAEKMNHLLKPVSPNKQKQNKCIDSRTYTQSLSPCPKTSHTAHELGRSCIISNFKFRLYNKMIFKLLQCKKSLLHVKLFRTNLPLRPIGHLPC